MASLPRTFEVSDVIQASLSTTTDNLSPVKRPHGNLTISSAASDITTKPQLYHGLSLPRTFEAPDVI